MFFVRIPQNILEAIMKAIWIRFIHGTRDQFLWTLTGVFTGILLIGMVSVLGPVFVYAISTALNSHNYVVSAVFMLIGALIVCTALFLFIPLYLILRKIWSEQKQ